MQPSADAGQHPLIRSIPVAGPPPQSKPALSAVVDQLGAALDAAQKDNEIYRLILESAGEGIYGLDAYGNTTFANPAAEKMIGWTAAELVGKPQHALIHHSHQDGSHYPRELCPIYKAIRDGKVHRSETEVFWRKDGTCFPVAYTSTPILDRGRSTGAVVLFNDISERKIREIWEKEKNSFILAVIGHAELDASLRMMAEAYKRLGTSSSIAIYLRADDGLRLAARSGSAECPRHSLTPILQHDDHASGRPGMTAWTRALESGKETIVSCCCASTSEAEAGLGSTEDPLQHGAADATGQGTGRARGTLRLVPLPSSTGSVLGVVAFFLEHKEGVRPVEQHIWDIGTSVCDWTRLSIEHHQLHTQLVRQSQHDHLTGLPNRLVLEDRLDQAIARAKRNGTQLAVCYVDLDEFKQVNDMLGHSAGDALLRHVASTLRQSLREIDTVARQGGDEFILLLPDLGDENEGRQTCERVLAQLRRPFTIGDQELIPAASIGMSFYPSSGDTALRLLQHADLALYGAKGAGRDRVEVFDSVFGDRMKQRIAIERELRFALDRNQFVLEYQPLYRSDLQLDGFEALLRWMHPTLGRVGPDQFIPIAEQTGLIVAIGEWVLREACRQAHAWNLHAPEPVRIFVNVSGVQLAHPHFSDHVAQALAHSGLSSRLLELEITETWIVADPAAASVKLAALRSLGIGIGIDDFGSGHATFSYLQQLPIDTVKIDRSLISCLDGSAKQSAVLRAVVKLAGELGLQTVAEGIETAPQLSEVRDTQCGMMQGFLFSKPVNAEAAGLLVGFRQPDHVESGAASC